MNEFQYWYQCVVRAIHDGDTMTLRFDLGRRIYAEDSIRLYRINAPELSQAGGKEARDYLRSIVPKGLESWETHRQQLRLIALLCSNWQRSTD